MPRHLLGDPMETLERLRPPEGGKHPTCEAVLRLLNEAIALLNARIGERRPQLPEGLIDIKPEILALAVGYGFEAMRNRSGPFSSAETRDAAQRGFVAGWISREFQEKVDAKAADNVRTRRRARINSGGKSLRGDNGGIPGGGVARKGK